MRALFEWSKYMVSTPPVGKWKSSFYGKLIAQALYFLHQNHNFCSITPKY
ncbi:conserved domain protein (plasmid) [Bacillus anthracis str. A0488]|uniref:Conserved domain protein n=1 Tax=Bacillus anthracis TaxID=1392 RepID=Q6EZM0_BACAN|nr:hypothetical protein BX_A0161 [Bacillus anthracis str. A2012]AAT28902.2 conserved domain protein [Bacillus anthracis str. 'Ames Ancestor']EDR16339.1 conserved domain protein [Bacillus anthracis str. A0488]EDR85370.1 conserved domain protein [Bacillus anthracis str. A0193]EDR90578.1 conserved domain protein [Bacillus anthracis str. A0442]EDS94483.1 conserved domain protein [Bacillus anthracis str. A0389]EDT17004.1 conserved domain protein [Bacillus anthracis str. A0465]EDT64924.1 conserved